jgi:SAM-dependent methyltransferase
MDKHMRANRDLWNEITPIHVRSQFYDVAGFKAGRVPLSPTPQELEEIGDVSGKSLLHLQCHFGMDSLCLARVGARVTGVDFSEEAIRQARALSEETGIRADFILSNVYDLKEKLDEDFDIVYTSGGVLCWLPDLKRWAEIIARYLKPGGFFYIMEGHPFLNVFDNGKQATDFKVSYSYFHTPEPIRWEPEGDYADKTAKTTHPTYEWVHSLGDIINVLVGAGLRIDFLHEFPNMFFRWSPFCEKQADASWHIKGDRVPMTFSLKATKA